MIWACAVQAQEVHVFEDPEPELGRTVRNDVSDNGDFRILVIPVVLQDSPFDPSGNLVNSYDDSNSNLYQDLVDRYNEMNDYWQEASNGQVSFTADVLERFYQMPRGEDFYFNPSFQAPELRGSPTLTEPVEVPEGQLQLVLHISDDDETVVTIEFADGMPPYSFSELNTHIGDQIHAQVGDKLEIETSLGSAVFSVGRRHIVEGSYVRLREIGNDPEVSDALGLDTPLIDLDGPQIVSRGAEFPLEVPLTAVIEFRVENESGDREDFSWTIPAANFPTAADFVSVHGADLTNATIAVNGEELQFDLVPSISGPIAHIRIVGAPHFVADGLGLDEISTMEGTVRPNDGDTIKGDRRLIAGQAIAAYMLNELTRPPDGTDDIPNTEITAANADELNALFNTQIDPYHGIAVVFLDVEGKRDAASRGFLDIGIENGDYLYKYQTYSALQFIYRLTDSDTIAHETGHNIGFPDLYDNSNGNYDPALFYPEDWDIMHQAVLNHPGAWMKIIGADWVVSTHGVVADFPMPEMPGTDTRRYVLTPLEYGADSYDSALSGVPAGRALAKTIRLPLGSGPGAEDHYLLIQNRQPGRNYSQDLPTATGAAASGGLYITDAITRRAYDYFAINTRNYVHPLTDRATVAGNNVSPILDRSPLDDIDLTAAYPAYAGITVDVVDQIPGPGGAASAPSYLVDVRREQADFLDLRIEPWGAPPYETPDIWIEHGDKPDEDLSDAPLEGNGEPARWSEDYDPAANDDQPLNWIRVKVTNEGTVEATGVQVLAKVNTPGGMGASGSWAALPLSEPKVVPANGGTAIFNIPWNPTVDSHTCIEAEVFRWTSPLGDLNLSNNGTQENITVFQPEAGSPWRPETFEIEVFNSLDRELDIELETSGLPPGFAVAFDKKFFTVPARGAVLRQASLTIDEVFFPPPVPDGSGGLLFFEYVRPVAKQIAAEQRPRKKPFREQFDVKGYVITHGHYRVPIGGITYDVRPTHAIEIEVQVSGDGEGNIVVTGGTEPPAGHQRLEVEIVYPSGRHAWIEIITDRDGTFEKAIEPEEEGTAQVTVTYPPQQLFGATRTGARYVDPKVDIAPPVGGIRWCIPCILQWVFWIVVLLMLLWIVVRLLRMHKHASAP